MSAWPWRMRNGQVSCEEQIARFAPGFKDTVPARQATQGAAPTPGRPTKDRNPGRLHSRRRQSVPCGREAFLTSGNLLQGQSSGATLLLLALLPIP